MGIKDQYEPQTTCKHLVVKQIHEKNDLDPKGSILLTRETKSFEWSIDNRNFVVIYLLITFWREVVHSWIFKIRLKIQLLGGIIFWHNLKRNALSSITVIDFNAISWVFIYSRFNSGIQTVTDWRAPLDPVYISPIRAPGTKFSSQSFTLTRSPTRSSTSTAHVPVKYSVYGSLMESSSP